MNIFLLLLYQCMHLQPSPLVPWRSLTWSDFRGKPTTGNAAFTKTIININTRQNDSLYNHTIECWFVPDESFTRVRRGDILQHEQLHFDITELYARQIRQLATSYQNCTEEKEADFERQADALLAEWKAAQVKYDLETDHSKITEAQERWEKEIKHKLSN